MSSPFKMRAAIIPFLLSSISLAAVGEAALAPNPTGNLPKAQPQPTSSSNSTATGRVYFLDIGLWDLVNGRILSTRPDGSDVQEVVGHILTMPDGVVVDVPSGHIYWTNMGTTTINTGSISRANLDGSNVTTIVPVGVTHTPKQIVLSNGKLYWSDREGMRIMCANPDGSNVETLLVTGSGVIDQMDKRNWCVGIAIDEEKQMVYWTQKGADDAGQGRIFRMPLQMSQFESPQNRTDVELLLDNLPEPIDLEIDPKSRKLYWTDRGNLPDGNSVSVASIDNLSSTGQLERQVLVQNLNEGIGISLDVPNNRMFFSDLYGSLYSSNLDGSNEQTIFAFAGNLTGVAYVSGLS